MSDQNRKQYWCCRRLRNSTNYTNYSKQTSQYAFKMVKNLCFVLFSTACIWDNDLVGAVLDHREPVCTSRYDYEYKVMKQLVQLDVEQDRTQQTMAAIQSKLNDLEDSNKQSEKDSHDLRARIHHLEGGTSNPVTSPGSTYIRWGRTSCPGNGTELVYEGYAAGSFYNNKGAASTYLCLPNEPLWNVFDDAEQDAGTVYGAEYEFLYRDQQKFFGKDLGQKDVPCSVCYTKRATVLMIPARNQCYPGWTLEYHGYLTSGHDTHHATEFVCIDEKPEALVGGAKNENGKLFYFTEARCDPLRCPPYVNGRELTCAVCSR